MKELPPVSPFITRRTARVARFEPETPTPSAIWIGLHGYRQLAATFLRHLAPLRDGARRLVAPEALNRFYVGDPDGRHGPETRVGATWMTREARELEIDDYVAYLDALAEAECAAGVPTVVLGFSQGAHAAARWMLRGGPEVRAVVLWGEGLPDEATAEALARRPRRWVLVRGEEDPARDPEREARDEERFAASGIEWEVRYHSGGHRIDRAPLLEVAAALGL
ncbi:MAG: hypothetical protein RQ745_04610 [Longimicrobiales bacterium]|nr:hypothetical protein [Longimicrobiales bacterium]